MADPFVAEIRMFGFNFAPKGWAFCDGQLLPISQNTALFALLGTYYGGDGKATFALPNLQGSVPIGVGQGPGLTPRDLGESGGAEAVSLTQAEIPAHTHVLAVSEDRTDELTSPSGKLPPGGGVDMYASGPGLAQMSPHAVAPTGIGAPHDNMMPHLHLNFCIALQGIFPPRP